MTWRYVRKGWQRVLQWATLLATILTGYAIILLPENDARRSQLETFYLHGDIFGWTLIVAAAIGLASELWMHLRKDESLLTPVSWCHIVCSGALGGFSMAALWGVIAEGSPNIGGPVLAALLALYHAAYVKRNANPSAVVLEMKVKVPPQ